MKSQLKVCFSLLATLTVTMAVFLLTMETNVNEPIIKHDSDTERVYSNTQDSLVTVNDMNATQMRPQLQVQSLNDKNNHFGYALAHDPTTPDAKKKERISAYTDESSVSDIATDTATQASAYTDESSVSATTTDTAMQAISNTTEDSSVSATATDTTTQVRPHSSDKGNRFGYVVSCNYYEQQTAALKNLFSLQCWAAQLNMTVVEPFIVESMFQTLLKTNVSDLFRFSDFYDIGQWNEQYAKPHSFLPLASWEDFVYNSPRDVILVQILTRGGTCSFPTKSEFFKKHHFRIVKESCVSLDKNKLMTTDEFNRLVLDEYYMLRNISIIFLSWRGICVGEHCVSRTLINTITNSKCDRVTLINKTDIQLKVSKRVNQDADLYVERYLKNSSYISVMLRLEYPIVTARKTKKKTDIVSNCTQTVHDTWKRLKNENQLNATFLTWDIGRFGSIRFEVQKNHWKAYEVTKHTQSLFTAIYGNLTSEEEWENRFVDVSGSTNRGYIALLQKSIAVRARCIVLAGGGTFQRHALKMYTDLHPHTQTQCIATFGKLCDAVPLWE